jgi:hypothetical protein
LHGGLALPTAGELVEERRCGLSSDDSISDCVRVALVDAARMIDAALELHVAALLHDVGSFVGRGVKALQRRSRRRHEERHRRRGWQHLAVG